MKKSMFILAVVAVGFCLLVNAQPPVVEEDLEIEEEDTLIIVREWMRIDTIHFIEGNEIPDSVLQEIPQKDESTLD